MYLLPSCVISVVRSWDRKLIVLFLISFRFSVPGGELQRVLDDEECVPERDAARLLRQILSGVSFLHEHNIAHLDLKVSSAPFYFPSQKHQN